jgi:hypothetical protein
MRILSFTRLSMLAIILSGIISCNEKEEFTTESINDYIPLLAGKSITYRVDSLVFTAFGRVEEIHKYQVKHVIDAQVLDNLGRPSYRVYRYISDSTGTQPWQASGTYFITPLSDQIELSEDNLRVIKLHAPIRDGYTWSGNTYLPPNPYGPLYTFSNDDNMEAWDFYYDGNPSSFSYRGFDYDDVLTVEQEDEAINVPITDPAAYGALSRAVERYSKTIGLVFREFTIWEYQPNTSGTGGPFKTGFGITMWMVDHN